MDFNERKDQPQWWREGQMFRGKNASSGEKVACWHEKGKRHLVLSAESRPESSGWLSACMTTQKTKSKQNLS